MPDTRDQPRTAADRLTGARIIDAVKQAGVRTVITVPDRTTEAGVLRPVSRDASLRHVRVCKEDEALGIAAALSYANHRALIMFQYTGLLDSLNAVRAVAVEYGMPLCMLVGLLEKEPGVAPSDSKKYGVRILEPILDTMEVAHHWLETDDDIGLIGPAIDEAYRTSRPVVMLVGRMPEAAP